MRTTVTLEPDVQKLVETAMKEKGISFKQAVNFALRSGLNQDERRRHSFVQETFSLGAEQSFRWDKAIAAAEAIEDEELNRKLSLRR